MTERESLEQRVAKGMYAHCYPWAKWETDEPGIKQHWIDLAQAVLAVLEPEIEAAERRGWEKHKAVLEEAEDVQG